MGKWPGSFYSIDVLGGPLDGTAGAMECTAHGIFKTNSPGSELLVANEFICGRLAMMMGLPVPPGGIVKIDDGSLGYLGMRFGLHGEDPAPANAEAFAQDFP